MCESKMHEVESGMEYQHITKDSEDGMHLSAVHEENCKRKKDSILQKIMLLMIKLFFSYSVAYFVSIWAIEIAYEERGYKAYGGEYILIIIAFIAAYYNISLFFKYFRR